MCEESGGGGGAVIHKSNPSQGETFFFLHDILILESLGWEGKAGLPSLHFLNSYRIYFIISHLPEIVCRIYELHYCNVTLRHCHFRLYSVARTDVV